jgi:hypothetical protein
LADDLILLTGTKKRQPRDIEAAMEYGHPSDGVAWKPLSCENGLAKASDSAA